MGNICLPRVRINSDHYKIYLQVYFVNIFPEMLVGSLIYKSCFSRIQNSLVFQCLTPDDFQWTFNAAGYTLREYSAQGTPENYYFFLRH